MSFYTKTFALCDNVDIRVTCETIRMETSSGIEYDEEYHDIELIIGKQTVKLEGEMEQDLYDAICNKACDIDGPDGYGEDVTSELLLLENELEAGR